MKERNIQIIAAAALFGILVWLSVAMREEYHVSVAAPLSIEDVPPDWAIRTPVPSAVQLRFRGDGWRLAGLLLGPEIQLAFSYTSFRAGKGAITTSDIAETIGLRAGIQLVDVKPDSIHVAIDPFAEKTVPVEPNYTISFRDGYGQVGSVMVLPESVTIGGAATILEHIDAWPTTQASFEDVRVRVDTRVPLESTTSYNLTFSTPAVSVRIDVQPIAEKVFRDLPVDVQSVPPTHEVILIPPRVELVVRGGIQQLSQITLSQFRVWVDYETIRAETTRTIETHVLAPEGTQIVLKRPERLEFIVRKRP
jgi:hypothetical protein